MISYNYLSNFKIDHEQRVTDWILDCANFYNQTIRQIDYIFCNDDYLLELNISHLNHHTYTDIITFDYSEDAGVSADLFISTDRVNVNSKKYEVSFEQELLRVMIHGLLHCLGFDDKTMDEKDMMKLQEELCLERYFH